MGTRYLKTRRTLWRTLQILYALLFLSYIALWIHSEFSRTELHRWMTENVRDARGSDVYYRGLKTRTRTALISDNGQLAFYRLSVWHSHPSASSPQVSVDWNLLSGVPILGIMPEPNEPDERDQSIVRYDSEVRRHHHSYLGFQYNWTAESRANVNGSRLFIAVPYWFLILVTALPLAITVYRRLRRHSFPPGHCLHCGYDLRASHSRCPECGTPFPRTAGVPPASAESPRDPQPAPPAQ